MDLLVSQESFWQIDPVWDVSMKQDYLQSQEWTLPIRQNFGRWDKESLRTAPTRDLPLGGNRPYPLLQFWSLAVYFNLEPDVTRTNGPQFPSVLNRSDEFCGFICLDGVLLTELAGAIKVPDKAFEMIVLAECNASMVGCSIPNGDLTVPAYLGYANGWKLYYVMLIEWNGGIAERRGFGQIYKSAVDMSLPPGPQWKEILLG
jgi:hypothetical protein